jgi:2-polyprenyl-3-methyl-5-hydroxy-6-metoxy-1,4-benzoquinol methylase
VVFSVAVRSGVVSAVQEWARQLAAWRIPSSIQGAMPESPWVLPREVFRRRADQQVAHPIGATHEHAVAALAWPGSVLDIGAAAGATSLPLAGRSSVTKVTAVDTDAELLNAFAYRAERVGLAARCVRGGWPQVASSELVADVVVVGNVLYNIPELPEFVDALTKHARRKVIIETADRHPLIDLNPYWQQFHGLTRPSGPTVHDAIAALAELGIRPEVYRWRRPPEAEHGSWADLVDVTRRRLCLPRSAASRVDAALRQRGVDPALPPDLGSSGRELTTLVWNGAG